MTLFQLLQTVAADLNICGHVCCFSWCLVSRAFGSCLVEKRGVFTFRWFPHNEPIRRRPERTAAVTVCNEELVEWIKGAAGRFHSPRLNKTSRLVLEILESSRKHRPVGVSCQLGCSPALLAETSGAEPLNSVRQIWTFCDLISMNIHFLGGRELKEVTAAAAFISSNSSHKTLIMKYLVHRVIN